MLLRSINWLAALVVGLCLAAGAPIQAAAETFMVVVNANNRTSGSEAELRELVRRLYLKQEPQWPSGLYSLPFARPAEDATTAAFAEAVLGMTPEALDAYWADQGKAPPNPIASARELFRQISRNEAAVSVVARSEAEKLPAKVRVLFEFVISPPASGEPPAAAAGTFDGEWILEFAQTDSAGLERIVVETSIVGNAFSVRFKGKLWEGQISGRIDESGELNASGWAVKPASSFRRFRFKADYIDGAFRADFEPQVTGFYSTRFTVALTPSS